MPGNNAAFNFDKLLEIANKAGLAKQFEGELADFSRFLADHHDFKVFIEDQRIAGSYKKKILKDMLPKTTSSLFFAVIFLLIDRAKTRSIGLLSAGYSQIYYASFNQILVEAVSVVPLENELILRIERDIETLMKKKISVRNAVDPKILGGLVLKIGADRMIDLSLRQRIMKMKNIVMRGAV